MLFKNTTSHLLMKKSLSRITSIFQLMGIQHFSISTEPIETNSKRYNRITRKFKLLLLANIAIVISEFCAILFAIYLEMGQQPQHNNVVAGQIVQFTSYNLQVIVLLTTIFNSVFLRGTTKKIFENCKIISEIVSTLNQSFSHHTSLENEFKKTFTKLLLSFMVSTVATLAFIYQYNQTNVLLWGIVTVYPYFFVMIVFSYWTLLVRLIRENLRSIKECIVQRLRLHKKVELFRISIETYNLDSKLKRNHETYNSIVKLKRIYCIIYETTSLVNEFIAAPICLLLILVVIANVSSGYKVFLSFKQHIPVERVAGKNLKLIVIKSQLNHMLTTC